MTQDAALPAFPSLPAQALGGLPLSALQWPLQQVIRSFARRHPAVFARLGPWSSGTFLIDPTDLPFAFRLCPDPAAPRIEAVRNAGARPWDARIAGPLAALLGMIHGSLDGDALFFSRDLIVEGDTEAALALRNALDDAEVDLLAEAAAAFAPLGPVLEPAARRALGHLGRIAGVALTRSED